MALVKVLNGYENAIENAADRYEPSIIAKVIALGSQQSRWNDAKWAGDIILLLAFFNYINICSITSSFAQLHHLLKFDAIKIDNEYDESYYLIASLYPLMSELMFE